MTRASSRAASTVAPPSCRRRRPPSSPPRGAGGGSRKLTCRSPHHGVQRSRNRYHPQDTMKQLTLSFAALFFCLGAAQASAQSTPSGATLRVVSTGPGGEIASVDEASEIRVVFSEPMVTLGRAPRVKPASFARTPVVGGPYRGPATPILFSPPPKRRPPAPRYAVTTAAGATAGSGRKLAEPVTFSFTTPTVKLLQTNWYRPGGRF